MVLDGIRFWIKDVPQFQVAGTALEGNSALAQIKDAKPDIIIVEVGLPGISVYALTQTLKETFLNLRVIWLTDLIDEPLLSAGRRQQIRGFIDKGCAADDFIYGLTEVLNGSECCVGNRWSSVKTSLRPEECRQCPLSLRQTQIITLVAQGLCNKQIAALLMISQRTVEKHRDMASKKLGLHCPADLTKYALRMGLISI